MVGLRFQKGDSMEIIRMVLTILSLSVIIVSARHKRLPGGLLEWSLLIATAAVYIFRIER